MQSDTVLERLARLEAEIASIKDERADRNKKLEEIDLKLTTLLSLRDKGAGAFWLASALAGVGAISIFVQILAWLGSFIGKH